MIFYPSVFGDLFFWTSSFSFLFPLLSTVIRYPSVFVFAFFNSIVDSGKIRQFQEGE